MTLPELLAKHQLPAEVIEKLLEQDREIARLRAAPTVVVGAKADRWERPFQPWEVDCSGGWLPGVVTTVGLDLVEVNTVRFRGLS